MEPKMLAQMAIEAMGFAYAPYSGYCVGAALLGENGKVYTGCNIENASFTPTVCAERTAVFKAVSEGCTRFRALAVCGGKGGELKGVFPPCGVCRQVLREFCDDDFPVFFIGPEGQTEMHTLLELLPYSFSAKGYMDT